MKPQTWIQLAVMMFLNYFVWGAWYVTVGTFMGTPETDGGLGFSGLQIGAVYATFSIAAIISPFFVGMIADRFFASERVLGVLHLVGAGLMYVATLQTDYSSFYLLILLYNLTFMPTIALTNSLAFAQMENTEKQFPAIRMLGTIGFIVVGWIVGFMKIEATALPQQIAAGMALVLGVYSFTLPHTPPKAKGQKTSVREILGLDALSLMKDRRFSTVIIASILICIPLAFYYSFANPFLNELGMENTAAKMTMGQMSEVLFLLVMPFFFARLGVRWMLTIGMAAWALRYLLFAYGDLGGSIWMLYGGIILHGICYDFFFVTGQIFVDKEAPAHLRSSAQGLITLATYGLGMFIGSYASGFVVDTYAISGTEHNWTNIWMIPAVFAVVVLVGFMAAFRNRGNAAAPA
ncbi:MAG: nucleoside permease [Bacteroidota bacterium]